MSVNDEEPPRSIGATVPSGLGEILAGKYRVERLIGAGGMGLVVLATHLELDRPVAIKLMREEGLKDAGARARFAREAKAVVRLKSEHIARVIDVGTLDSGAPYLVMEYLEGRDLATVLDEQSDNRLPLLAKLNQPGGIAVDDRYVFWTDTDVSGSLNRMDKADPTQIQRITGQESPIGVTLDAEFVYWTVIGGGPQGVATAGVYRARKSDLGGVTKLARSSDPDQIIPYAIAVDDTWVYWTSAPDLDDQDASQPCHAEEVGGLLQGAVRRVKKAGGLQPSNVVIGGQACPLALALDDATVYWANLGAGTALAGSVWSKPKEQGSPQQLAAGIGRPTSLALAGGRLSWNVPASQRVDSCLLPDCKTTVTLARDQRNPSGLSADTSGIYWAVLGTVNESFTDGAVRRATAPDPDP